MYADTTPEQLRDALAGDDPPFVLDVREPDEVAVYGLPQAVNIPLGSIAQRGTEIPRDRHIVVVCRSGRRSATAALALSRFGFDVSNLVGGMIGWARMMGHGDGTDIPVGPEAYGCSI
jgi:rhodanese-related sulfurtransferase